MIAERQEELAALGAVDLLSPAEQAEFDAAVAADPALAALLASFRSTAADLAHSAPPVVPPTLLKPASSPVSRTRRVQYQPALLGESLFLLPRGLA
jgi:anti-sigma factor RsiW